MGDRPSTVVRKPHTAGRMPRVLGWALLVAGGLIAADWVVSAWWSFNYLGPAWTVSTRRGTLQFVASGWKELGSEPGWFLLHVDEPLRWILADPTSGAVAQADQDFNLRIVRRSRYGTFVIIDVVLWLPALAALGGGGVFLRSGQLARRRAMMGHCHKCGYNLAGLAAGAPCPECGGRKGPAALSGTTP